MKKTISIILLFVVTLSSITIRDVKASVAAEETVPSCYSLDVIFVVDQSGSMSDSISATDPTNQRETAVEAMVDWLSENVLDRCKEARHQVGVISFGTEARVDLPLTEIAPDSFEELLALESRLHEKIVADDMGWTIPINAFQKIPGMFQDSQITAGGPRKRVVVFLTDGVIDYGDQGNNKGGGYVGATRELVNYINQNFPYDPTLLKREECISFQVQAYGKFENIPYDKLHECMQENVVDDAAYANSIYLYMVLMNFGQSWPKEIKGLYKDAVQKHAGEVMDFYETGQENRQEIPTYFQNVFSKLSGIPSGQVECGGVAVNPYLEKAVFVFYKFSPDTKVSLRYIDNNTVHQIVGGKSDTGGFDVVEYQSYGANERYTFIRPYPGIWFIESDRCANGGINAFYQPVKINPGGFTLSLPSLAQHDLDPYYDISDPVYLTYKMYNDAGDLIVQSDQDIFKIDAQAMVTDPNGEAVAYDLDWIASEQLFRSNKPLLVPVDGDYYVSFRGVTKVHKGEMSVLSEDLAKTFDTEEVLFQHENLMFNVRKIEPFIITPVKPVNGQMLPQIHGTIFQGWPLPVVPINVRVRIDKRNSLLDIPVDQILTDPNNSLTAWLVNGDGKESERVVLHRDLETDGDVDAEFTGSIPWGGIEETLTLHVRLTGEYSQDYQPDNREIEVAFSRSDSSPIYRSGFYILLLILLIITIIILILIYWYAHTDCVRGRLVIQLNSVPVRTDDLYSGKRVTTFKYGHDEGTDLGKIHVKYMPKTKGSQEDQDVPREIRVWGETEHKTKISIEGLGSGTSAGYCTEHIEYSFLYESEK